MNLYRLAVIALRVWGVTWLISGLLRLLSIPTDVLGLLHAHTEYFSVLAKIPIATLFIRIVFEAGAGLTAMIASKPLARFLIGSSADLPSDRNADQTVWPPPPQQPVLTNLPGQIFPSALTLQQCASLLIRSNGLYLFILFVLNLTQLPDPVYGLSHHHNDYWASQYLLEVCTNIMGALILLGAALYFFFLSERFAIRITRDLVHDAETDTHEVTAALPSEDISNSETMTGR